MTQRTTLAAFRRSIPLFALSLAFFACSNDDNHDDLSSSSDVGLSSSSNVELLSSSSVTNSLLLNFTSDYSTGELRWMALNSTSLLNGTLPFEQDSKVSAAGGNIFILGNDPGTISCISPQSIGSIGDVKQKRLEADYPYEAAVIGSNGYIALNDADYVQVFNTSTCTPGEKISLPISGANASTIKASGDTLLVTLQRLENWSATKPGLLVRIKASTKTVIDTIQLKYYNPSSSVLSDGKLYVSLQGAYNEDYSIDVTKAGIEVVDLATGIPDVLATGTELGGGAGGIALAEANKILYASVSVSWGNSPVKPINLATKSIGSTLPDIIASGDIVFDSEGKKLFVGDRDLTNPALKVYDPVANETTIIGNQNPLLPPYSLAIVKW